MYCIHETSKTPLFTRHVPILLFNLIIRNENEDCKTKLDYINKVVIELIIYTEKNKSKSYRIKNIEKPPQR